MQYKFFINLVSDLANRLQIENHEIDLKHGA